MEKEEEVIFKNVKLEINIGRKEKYFVDAQIRLVNLSPDMGKDSHDWALYLTEDTESTEDVNVGGIMLIDYMDRKYALKDIDKINVKTKKESKQ